MNDTNEKNLINGEEECVEQTPEKERKTLRQTRRQFYERVVHLTVLVLL